MSDYAVRVAGLGKHYRIGARPETYVTLRDSISRFAKRPWRRPSKDGAAAKPTDFWALKDVSFDVPRGEVVGVIGKNGAGKSTLLKIVSRITEPTTGEIRVRGRVGSLLEVGTGFHPELTGRENIYLNGAILGMGRKEIDRRFDEIVDFSGVERFIDTAVKHYSSGMYLRLAFGVAAHLDMEILIVDEVLAVGDAEFQRKCLGKMDAAARSGRTVLMVTHNMAAVDRFCKHVGLLEQGRLTGFGPAKEITARYLHMDGLASYEPAARTGRPQFIAVALSGESGVPAKQFACAEAIAIALTYALPERHHGVDLGIGVLSAEGMQLFTSSPRDEGRKIPDQAGEHTVTVTIPENALLAGEFHLAVAMWDARVMLDWQEPALSFSVVAGASPLYLFSETRKGFVHIPCQWQVETPSREATAMTAVR